MDTEIRFFALNCTKEKVLGRVQQQIMLGYDWWLCMVINISIHYSGGLLPDIILLTQGYYQWETRLNTM